MRVAEGKPIPQTTTNNQHPMSKAKHPRQCHARPDGALPRGSEFPNDPHLKLRYEVYLRHLSWKATQRPHWEETDIVEVINVDHITGKKYKEPAQVMTWRRVGRGFSYEIYRLWQLDRVLENIAGQHVHAVPADVRYSLKMERLDEDDLGADDTRSGGCELE